VHNVHGSGNLATEPDARRPAGAALAWLDARRDSAESARQRVLGVAETFAHSPDVVTALHSRDPAAQLQPLAESVRQATGVDFVVVMSRDRVRYSHPNPALIGERFIGNTAPALAGQPFTETFTGTLGPSVRAVVPVPGERRPVEGLVAVGITQTKISTELARQVPALLGLVALLLALAAFGSLLVSRRMQRFTHGLGPGRADPALRAPRRRPARHARGAAGPRPGAQAAAGQRRGR
jgi:two-component system, CitB family, sensor kinase